MKKHYERNKRDPRQWGWSGVLASYGPWEPRYRINFYLLSDYGDRHAVMNEKRQNKGALKEEDIRYYNVKVRRKRCNVPTKWDDERIARWGGRSWKDYTKQRNQWG